MDNAPSNDEFSRERRLRLPLPPATIVGLMAAIVAVGVMAFFTYRASESRQVAAGRITASMQLIQELESLLSELKDAETAQRGYLLTAEERYLEPFLNAQTAAPQQLASLRRLLADNVSQRPRLDELERIANEKFAELRQTIDLKRSGQNEAALAIVRSDRGKAAMDRMRTLVAQIEADERKALLAGQAEWQAGVARTSLVIWGGSALLVALIVMAAMLLTRDARAREQQSWVRAGHATLASRLQGEQRLERLGERTLRFLVAYLDAHVGAVYVAEGGAYRRIASYGISAAAAPDVVRPGDGLIGEAVKAHRVLHLTDVPDGYLAVSSALGRANPASLIVAPAVADGVAYAAIELGFFGPVRPEQRLLLERVSETVAVAVRSSGDRTRLEELLEETQRQAEELQTQQEELRVSNEELEEQGSVLRASQARLETQQVELEEINRQLEEQTEQLELQRDEVGRAQLVLAAKADELERANHYKTEFLANMSHELRTPLNSSLILARLLADNREGNLTPQQIKSANTILSAGNDLLVLINDILDLSKIEAGKVELNIEPVPVAHALDGLVKTLQPVAQQKSLGFTATIEPGAPAHIQTDAQRLSQILKNLLSNAFKFTRKGEVALRVFAPEGGRVSFSVRDTGIGIAPEQQAVIFDAFRQADGSTHRRYGGSGLGLSISRDLARLLGGDISVASSPGEGSVFTLTIPVVYVPPAETTPAAPPAPPEPKTQTAPAFAAPAATPSRRSPGPAIVDDRLHLSDTMRRILVIEDDQRFASVLCDMAHELGFHCIVTHSANDGLDAALTYLPNGILLDIHLPDHSGLGVLDQLKRNPRTRHIPVHIISVADHMHQALELGAIGYALKPVQRDELVAAFRKLDAKLSQGVRRVLVVEDDDRQRDAISQLLAADDVQITAVGTAAAALERLRATTFDCMVMDLKLPDLGGYDLLEKMAGEEGLQFPPVIVYTGRSLTRDEEQQLRRFSKSIIIKDARSPERLLDEVTLFLHQVEASLPAERQRMLKVARDRDAALEGRGILIVEDDARNIYALTSLLEPRGARLEIARNGLEAIDVLTRAGNNGNGRIDLVLMDIMMPEMDGFTAMREIRKRPEWQKLPIVALTAKAMKDDQDKCLAAGANDYIAKPLDPEKLMSLVRVWMPK